jgi:hypothetical protein
MQLTTQQLSDLWDTHFHSRSSYYWLDFAEALLVLIGETLPEKQLVEMWEHHCDTRLPQPGYLHFAGEDKNKGVEFGQDILNLFK